MRPVRICVLGKYNEVFQKFYESLQRFPQNCEVTFVRDGEDIPVPDNPAWHTIQGPERFAMAGNGNLALQAAPIDHDILYCGDDIRFLSADTIQKLQDIAYSKKEVGILSPKLIGRGSPMQVNPPAKLVAVPPIQMWFPCVYIKRELIDKIGYLDERFNDFGCDDFDYCIRAIRAGYILAVTSQVAVEHEGSPEGGPTTFVKKFGMTEFNRQQREAQLKICEKYQVTQPVFNDFLRTGNPALLENNGKSIPIPEYVTPDTPKEQAAAYLRSRHVYIATPAYGGQFSVNYVTALIALVESCKNLGITYSHGFLYNESLITRARNKLVDLFLKTDATDLFFIDADIGFNPQDVISLLLHKEEIIAVPCARKNLRLDRVFNYGYESARKNIHEVAKKCNGEYKDFIAAEFKVAHETPAVADLRKICGEYVLNFPPDQVPSSFNLGQLLEVQDGGTGFMRIRRETFKKFADAYPDRWYMPMHGEEGEVSVREPTFMYFQSRIDPDSAKFDPSGYPDYISEDYAFCRDARKIGIKVYAAPWIETSHFGAYRFDGNLLAVTQAGGGLR